MCEQTCFQEIYHYQADQENSIDFKVPRSLSKFIYCLFWAGGGVVVVGCPWLYRL